MLCCRARDVDHKQHNSSFGLVSDPTCVGQQVGFDQRVHMRKAWRIRKFSCGLLWFLVAGVLEPREPLASRGLEHTLLRMSDCQIPA